MMKLTKKAKKWFSAFLAACLLTALLPVQALAVDNVIWNAGGGGYCTINRYTGTLSNAVNITGEVTIPESVQGVPVTSIAARAFYGFEDLIAITVPDSVESVGDQAFGACTSLKSAKLGAGVTKLGKNAFQFCYSLTDVSLPAGLTAIDDYTFERCLALRSISIPSGVTSLGSYVFARCKNLESVSLPNGITQIGEYSFSQCTSLVSLDLPDSLSALPISLFDGCTALSEVSIPGSAVSIGKNAFGGCSSLATLAVPEGVEKIYDWAFNGCSSLSAISMPDSVNSIAADSFYGCGSVTFYVNPGSYSQVFAAANSIPFELGTFGGGEPDPGPGPVTEMPFTDVENHWAKEDIRWAYDKGYFTGMTPTTFQPETTVNRAMMAMLLYRIEGNPAVGRCDFTDVSASAYFADAVAWCQSTGVVNGMGDGRFAPNRSITRQELATMLYRYAQYKKMNVSARGDLSGFQDAGEIADYADGAMAWAVGSNLISGMTASTLAPRGTATRAQAAAIFRRFASLK